MACKAFEKFEANKVEVERLLDIHGQLTGDAPGRRYNVGVLNKSAIIMTCACWEAFVEDLSEEATLHLTKYLDDPTKIPKEVIESIMARGAQKDAVKFWKVVTSGWKTAVKTNSQFLARLERGWGLNTPNSDNVHLLMRNSMGISSVSEKWYWAGMSREQAIDKLNRLVSRRGELAHGTSPARGVNKAECTDYLNFVERLAKKTEASVKGYLSNLTGKDFP